MNKLHRQQKVTYSSSDDDDEDCSPVKINWRSRTGNVHDDDDSPINHLLKKKNINRITSSDDSDDSDKENGSRHSTNASSEFGGQHSRSKNVSILSFFLHLN